MFRGPATFAIVRLVILFKKLIGGYLLVYFPLNFEGFFTQYWGLLILDKGATVLTSEGDTRIILLSTGRRSRY